MVSTNEPGGFAAISRWLSPRQRTTPPEIVMKLSAPWQGARRWYQNTHVHEREELGTLKFIPRVASRGQASRGQATSSSSGDRRPDTPAPLDPDCCSGICGGFTKVALRLVSRFYSFNTHPPWTVATLGFEYATLVNSLPPLVYDASGSRVSDAIGPRASPV